MKILPMGAEWCHADGRTDTKLVVVFDNFANAPKGDDVVMIDLHDSL